MATDAKVRSIVVSIACEQSGSYGTGFFIAPSTIVTCAHVVSVELENNYSVYWNNEKLVIKDIIRSNSNYPDLALVILQDNFDHPLAFLHSGVGINDDLYLYGYPDGPTRQGDSITLRYEGLGLVKANDTNALMLKVKDGQILGGFSGSPILNLRTGAICSIIAWSRDVYSNLGGRAVSVDEIMKLWPSVIRNSDELHRKWWSGQPGNQTIYLIYSHLRSCTAGSAGPDTLWLTPDNLTNKNGEVEIPHLSRNFLSCDKGFLNDINKGYTSLDLIEHSRLEKKVVVIEGSTGSGKSSELSWISRTLAENSLSDGSLSTVPIAMKAIELQECLEKLAAPFTYSMMPNERHAHAHKLHIASLALQTNGINLVFLIDGYDEIPTRKRILFKKLISQLMSDTNEDIGSRVSIILTSRPSAAMPLRMSKLFSNYSLADFSEEDVSQLARYWLPESFSKFLGQFNLLSVHEFRKTPLLLAICLKLYAKHGDNENKLQMVFSNMSSIFHRLTLDYISMLCDKAPIVRDMLESFGITKLIERIAHETADSVRLTKNN